MRIINAPPTMRAINMIQIKKFEGDISKLGKRGRPAKYPWKEMKVGDCFKVAYSKTINSLASQAAKSIGAKFSVISDGDEMTVIRIA